MSKACIHDDTSLAEEMLTVIDEIGHDALYQMSTALFLLWQADRAQGDHERRGLAVQARKHLLEGNHVSMASIDGVQQLAIKQEIRAGEAS